MNIGINAFKTWADTQINNGAGDQAVMLRQQPNAPRGNRPLANRNMRGIQGAGIGLGNVINANRANGAARQGAVSPFGENTHATGTAAYKQANNDVRTSLLNMVRRELGLAEDAPISSFPASVQKAMNYRFLAKLFNYFNDWSATNARPLSARSISAVVEAVKKEKAAKTEKPVNDLKNLNADVANVVNGDTALQKALKANPQGAEQLCNALKKSDVAKHAFVNNGDFRAMILNNLKDGFQCPLPIGKLTIPAAGKGADFANVKKDVSELLETAFKNVDVEGKYEGMLNQCCKDYARSGRVIKVDGEVFDMRAGLKLTAGDPSPTLENQMAMETNISALLAKLGLPNSKAMRMQMLEFLTQGSQLYTTLGAGQLSRLSLPADYIGLNSTGEFASSNELCTYSFSTKGGDLKCDLSTNAHVSALGRNNDTPIALSKKSTIKTGISVGLKWTQDGTETHPWKLSVTSAGAPSKGGTTTLNLDLDRESYTL